MLQCLFIHSPRGPNFGVTGDLSLVGLLAMLRLLGVHEASC